MFFSTGKESKSDFYFGVGGGYGGLGRGWEWRGGGRVSEFIFDRESKCEKYFFFGGGGGGGKAEGGGRLRKRRGGGVITK